MEIEIPDLDDLTFVVECVACRGVGKIQSYQNLQVHDCWRCEGAGKHLTQVGTRLITFLDSLGIGFDKHGWKK